MKFPVLALDPSSFARLFLSEAELVRIPMFYVGLYRKRKATLEFYDSAGSLWKLESVTPVKPLSLFRRLWPSINEIEVRIDFRSLGSCPLDQMKDTFRKAVEADDDILKQDEEEADILAKLDATKSVGEVFRLYRWMTKDFRKKPIQSPQHNAGSGPRSSDPPASETPPLLGPRG
jgi:hypothetical protein